MRTVITRRTAAGVLAAAGILHGMIAPEYLSERPYIGALFALSVPLTLAVATMLWVRDDVRAWAAGAALAAGMAVAFVLSRTTGLPSFHEHNWVEGIPTLVAEAAFLVLAAPTVLARRMKVVGTGAVPAR